MARFVFVAMIFVGLFAADDLLAAADDATWGSIKSRVAGEEPSAKLTVSEDKVGGTKEVLLTLEVVAVGDQVVATVSVARLDGRTLAGWDVEVSYDPQMITPAEYRSGDVVGPPEENFGLGGFITENNPDMADGVWSVHAASPFGRSREGSLFTLVFDRLSTAHVSRMGIGIELVKLFDEHASRYSVAVVHGRAATEGEFLSGDVNGDGRVNITDAAMIATHLQNGGVLTEPWQFIAADFDRNGKIQPIDAHNIARLDLGLPPILLGDVSLNGEIWAYDWGLILRYLGGKESLTKWQLVAADINQDGIVTVEDADMIRAIELRKIPHPQGVQM